MQKRTKSFSSFPCPNLTIYQSSRRQYFTRKTTYTYLSLTTTSATYGHIKPQIIHGPFFHTLTCSTYDTIYLFFHTTKYQVTLLFSTLTLPIHTATWEGLEGNAIFKPATTRYQRHLDSILFNITPYTQPYGGTGCWEGMEANHHGC